MVMEDLTVGGGHTVQYTDHVSQNCALETCTILKILLFIFREEGREKERETHTSMRERSIEQLLLVHTLTRDQTCIPGMYPDQNRTSDLLLCRTMPNQLSHTSQGKTYIILLTNTSTINLIKFILINKWIYSYKK